MLGTDLGGKRRLYKHSSSVTHLCHRSVRAGFAFRPHDGSATAAPLPEPHLVSRLFPYLDSTQK